MHIMMTSEAQNPVSSPSSPTEGLSAFVLTFNEEGNIGPCLETLGFCDEVIVVDSESTDNSVMIAEKHAAQIVRQEWQGYARQKNLAISHCAGPWILWIDADERVTPQLAREIRLRIRNSALNGFQVPRRLFFLRKKLGFGGVGKDHPLRLFRKDAVWFPEDQLVHEKPTIRGRTGRLKAELNHHSYASLEAYLTRLNRYTTLAAQQMLAQKRRFHPGHLLIPFWELFERLVLRAAFLDGVEGIAFAILSSCSVLVKYLKLRELDKTKGRA